MGENSAQRKEGEESKDTDTALMISRVVIRKRIETGAVLILD